MKLLPIERAAVAVRRRGVDVVFRKYQDGFPSETVHRAPQNDAVVELRRRRRARIWWWDEETDGVAACGLIHEAAHVLMGGSPDEIDSPMLWWELEMQREAGVLYARGDWMADFGLGDFDCLKNHWGEWGVHYNWVDASRAMRERVMQWSRWRAMEMKR